MLTDRAPTAALMMMSFICSLPADGFRNPMLTDRGPTAALPAEAWRKPMLTVVD
jgi:hypothetical protein